MKRILIIDDNIETADLLALIFQLEGYETKAVYGPEPGLRAVAEFVPDVVFLDIGMPAMNGYEVAATIRHDLTVRQPYLIAFTAWNDAASIAKAMDVGFDWHVAKTSSLEILRNAIHSAA